MKTRRLTFPVAVMLAAQLIPAPASGGAGEYLTTGDLLPGTCHPAVILEGQSTDCRFPLARAADLDPWLGPHFAAGTPFSADEGAQADCIVAGDELLCRGVPAFYGGPYGPRVVTPIISFEAAPVGATFSVDRLGGYPIILTGLTREAFVFPGQPLRLWVDGEGRTGGGSAVVRERDGGVIVATVRVPAVPDDEFEPVAILVDLEPGRYRITPCVDTDDGGCEEVPGGVPFQVGSGGLTDIVPGWNRVDADRINIVFAASGFDDLDQARRVAHHLLGWDGPLLFGAGDEPLDGVGEAGDVWTVDFGPFAIEPLRSAKGLFNLWMIDDMVADPRTFSYSAPPFGSHPPPFTFDLPDVHVTTLHLHHIGRSSRSEAGWSSFTSPDGPSPVDRDGLEFASAYLSLTRWAPLQEGDTLAHEWGHALFDLRDEYVEESRSVTHGYPNCAPDEDTALEWWGHLLGEVDPFLFEYVEVLESHGLWTDPDLVESFRVRLIEGGCYSAGGDAVRPTIESLMNGQTPVFGAVNRERVAAILSLWSGTAPLSAGSDLTLVCEDAGGRRVARCGGEVAAFVVVPHPGLVLRAGEAAESCDWHPGDPGAVGVFSCPPLRLDGGGPWVVSISLGDGDALALEQVHTAVPVRTPLTKAPVTIQDAGIPLVPILLAVVVALAGVGSVLAWAGIRRRGSSRHYSE